MARKKSPAVIRETKRLGKEIQTRRLAHGLTQETLAEAVNLSVEMIKVIEQGRGAPGFESLIKITRTLGIKIVYKG